MDRMGGIGSLELIRSDGHRYAILFPGKEGNKFLYSIPFQDQDKAKFISPIVEATIKDGHFELAVRGEERFDILGLVEHEEVDTRLYKKAREIAVRVSELCKIAFKDLTPEYVLHHQKL
jgi:hypothetical protein